MNKLYLPLIGLFFLGGLVPCSMGADLKNIKGMWVWDIGGPVIRDAAKQSELLRYAKAPHGDSTFSINRLYFEARTYNKNSQPYSVISDPLSNSDAGKLQT